MEFENLRGLLGEAYHDGITAEEVNNFFAGKSFADLSTGQYVDKNKYERDIQNLNNTIKQQKTTIDSKLTDDEKLQAQFDAKDTEITRLQELLKQNTMQSNGDLVKGLLSSTKELLEIKDDDSDFAKFLTNIISEDRNMSNEIATYYSTSIKNAYEKGKKDATKDAMGNFGKGYKSAGGENDKDLGIGAILGKKVAENNNKEQFDYFKRNK